jgi:asparagine synthase (glutamine-hydrolysing)
MCGIAGWLPSDPSEVPSSGALSVVSVSSGLQQALRHRGPDDAGLWQDISAEGSGSILVHQRLAIQDLSPGGHQPMVSACGRYVLVFNGELYNQLELRFELETRGHCFRSASDTEVLLELLARDGLKALPRLRGMYAFCFWDRLERKALLARDPYGIKPLYLWQSPVGGLLFASELRAILASGLVERRLNTEALVGFLSCGSVPEPLSFVLGVASLPAGHWAHWQHGALRMHRHWSPRFESAAASSTEAGAQRCRQALADSVQAHLLSDVPVGLFLSGGLDSAAVLALAPRGLTTLTIGFPQASHDESARASQLARQFGSHHIPLELDVHQAAGFLPGFLDAIDQPTVDGFNTYCVSALAHQQGLKVVLSGLGGDELFGGYPSFQRVPRLLRWHRRLGPLRFALAQLLARQPGHRQQRLAAFLAGPATAAAAHRCQRGLFAAAEVRRLLQHWQLEPSPLSSLDAYEPDGALSADLSLADQIAWLESSRYMGQQLLRDSDVYSMAHGLELRLPLVDSQLFAALSQIPARERLAQAKQLLQHAVPEITAQLPLAAKRGFALPFQSWFEQPHSPMQPGTALPLPSTPDGLDLSPWARRWSLIVLHHWLRSHLNLELPLATSTGLIG